MKSLHLICMKFWKKNMLNRRFYMVFRINIWAYIPFQLRRASWWIGHTWWLPHWPLDLKHSHRVTLCGNWNFFAQSGEMILDFIFVITYFFLQQKILTKMKQEHYSICIRMNFKSLWAFVTFYSLWFGLIGQVLFIRDFISNFQHWKQ